MRATNGTTLVCDSGEIAFGNGTLDPLDGVAVAESKLGIVVAVTDGAGNQASVFLFDEHCSQSMQGGKALSSFQSYEHPHGPRIAVGGSHIAFAWTVEGSGGAYNSYVRVMPEALCE